MRIDDPSRPLMAERPTYGQGMAVLPELRLWPLGGGLCRISAWLARTPSAFCEFETLWETSQLPRVLEDYRADPETTLLRLFNWQVPLRPVPKPESASNLPLLSLSDLEDDDGQT